MAQRHSSVPFSGTPEQEAELRALIEAEKNRPGALMGILQKAQDIYGYLPEEVQIMIAEGLGISLSEVYGVVTFYTQFTLDPKGQYSIGVCMGTACYVRGSADVLDAIKKELGIEVGACTSDGKFSLTATRCLGCCGLAPVMTVNDEVYGRLTPNDIPGIIAKYRA